MSEPYWCAAQPTPTVARPVDMHKASPVQVTKNAVMILPFYAVRAECHLCALHFLRSRAASLPPFGKAFSGFSLAVFE